LKLGEEKKLAIHENDFATQTLNSIEIAGLVLKVVLTRPVQHRMKLLRRIGREFSGYKILESGKRLFDRKPLQCSLYVTDRCNLDCSYCTEYDNSRPHPSIDDLKKWIRKIRELGTMHRSRRRRNGASFAKLCLVGRRSTFPFASGPVEN